MCVCVFQVANAIEAAGLKGEKGDRVRICSISTYLYPNTLRSVIKRWVLTHSTSSYTSQSITPTSSSISPLISGWWVFWLSFQPSKWQSTEKLFVVCCEMSLKLLPNMVFDCSCQLTVSNLSAQKDPKARRERKASWWVLMFGHRLQQCIPELSSPATIKWDFLFQKVLFEQSAPSFNGAREQ